MSRRFPERKVRALTARQPQGPSAAEWALLGLLTLGLLIGVSSLAFAGVAADPAAKTAPVEKVAPQGEDAPGADDESATPPTADDEDLSRKLDQQDGVIQPPATGDSGIYGHAPDPDPGTTRVIPTPGSPGGDQSVEPK